MKLKMIVFLNIILTSLIGYGKVLINIRLPLKPPQKIQKQEQNILQQLEKKGLINNKNTGDGVDCGAVNCIALTINEKSKK